MSDTVAQIIGYAASVLLAISLLVNNDLKFRWFNMSGQIAFIAYGFMINAFPVIVTNTLLLFINIYRLYKLYRAHEDFELVEVREDSKIVPKLLSFYKADISPYFPGFRYEDAGLADVKFVVLRDVVIANVFVALVDAEGTAHVKINYTIPKYRDYKVGKFIFDKEKHYLASKGIRKIWYQKNTLIISAVVAAGVAAYLLLRNKFRKEEATAPERSHHLTNVFSKAKEYAMHN